MLQLFKTKCLLMTREYIALFFTIIFCPMLLILFGSIFGNDPSPVFNNKGTVDVMIPSYVGLVFAGSGLISLPVAVASSKERGELRRYQLTPISPMFFLLADVIMYFIISIIGMALVMLIGAFAFESSFTGNWLHWIMGFCISGICIFSIGLFIAALSNTAKLAQTFGMLIGFPMMFLSGSGMPLEMMPETVKDISKFLPLSYSVSLMKDIWEKVALSKMTDDILVLLAVSVVFFILTALTFKWE